MYLCCNTKSFRLLRYKNQWNAEQTLHEIASTGAQGVIMETELFPERAMYWTRMARENIAKKGMTLVALFREADLTNDSSLKTEQSIADLMEWVRIAALSNIPYVKIELSGAFLNNYQAIESAFRRVIDYAAKYGTKVIFGSGRVVTLNELVSLIKRIGFSDCRIAAKAADIEDSLKPWIQETIVEKYIPHLGGNGFITVEPTNGSQAPEEIRATIASLKGKA